MIRLTEIKLKKSSVKSIVSLSVPYVRDIFMSLMQQGRHCFTIKYTLKCIVYNCLYSLGILVVADTHHVGDVGRDGFQLSHELVPNARVVLPNKQ